MVLMVHFISELTRIDTSRYTDVCQGIAQQALAPIFCNNNNLMNFVELESPLSLRMF